MKKYISCCRKQCLICADFSPDSDKTVFTRESNIMDYGLVFQLEATVWGQNTSYWICFLQTHSFSLHKTLTDGLEWCGLLVGLLWCFYQVFRLSFWWHPFTAEDPLLSKWCYDTFLQIWWRNKFIYILDGLRVKQKKKMKKTLIFHFLG